MTSDYSIASLPPSAAQTTTARAVPHFGSEPPDARIATAEVHVVPVRGTAKWRVHDGDPSEPASEHVSTTAAEAAAYSRAIERGADRIVIHDRYHRTRLIESEHPPDQHSADSPAADPPVDRASAS